MFFLKASFKRFFLRFLMPIFTKTHASTKLWGILWSSKHENCSPRQDLSNGTKSAPIWLRDQKVSQKYRNILFFSLIFASLSLPFSYLGYIVEEGNSLWIIHQFIHILIQLLLLVLYIFMFIFLLMLDIH